MNRSILLVLIVVVGLLVSLGLDYWYVNWLQKEPIYTAPLDTSRPEYKYLHINYGDANTPKLQAAPDEWIKVCGDTERTLLLYTMGELRVIVAQQGKLIGDLMKADPNKGK